MSIFSELKRRNVFRAAAVYAVVAWLLIQIVATIESPLSLPDWFDTAVIVLLAIGFPIAVVLSWAFELTPDGIKPSSQVDLDRSITRQTGQKLNRAIIVILLITVGFLVVDNYVLERPIEEGGQDRHSIAALPFSNESATADDAEFLANGLHDEVLTQLSKIHSLKVISRTSVEAYRNAARNIRQIGEELGVANILEGRVQRAGNMLRINVQLIDAETDEHLWAETYDRELTAENIFSVQAEMAAAIADALEATLTPEERAQLATVPTTSIRAYNFYLAGRDLRHTPAETGVRTRAVEQLERAVREDPEFALAWAELAGAHLDMYWFGEDHSDARRRSAREAVERAFEIVPDLPEAHLAMAEYHYHGFRDYERALAELEIAAPRISENSDYFLNRGAIHRRLGNWQRAIDDFDRARELDPRRADILLELGNTYVALRDYDMAQSYYERGVGLSPGRPPFELATLALGRDANPQPLLDLLSTSRYEFGRFGNFLGWYASILARNYDDSIRYLEGVEGDGSDFGGTYVSWAAARGMTLALAGEAEAAREQFTVARDQLQALIASQAHGEAEDSRYYLALATALAGLGDRGGALGAADRALALMPPSRDAMIGRDLQRLAAVMVFLPLGETDRAMRLIDEVLSSPGQDVSIEEIAAMPWVDPVRDDPRFVALVEKHRRQN